MYQSPQTGSFSVSSTRGRPVAQSVLTDADGDGRIEGTKVRQWDVGTEVEGCVADDELGDLYISEEDVGIWKYGAEPTARRPRPRVAGRPDDRRGRTHQARCRGSDDRLPARRHRLPDRVVAGRVEHAELLPRLRTTRRQPSSGVQGRERADGRRLRPTDGIDALAADLGPAFPKGLFVCQDNNNTARAPGNQNFKFVPLERVVGLIQRATAAQPPVAVSTYLHGLGSVTSGTGSTDPDGTVECYAWNLGDGAPASGRTAAHVRRGGHLHGLPDGHRQRGAPTASRGLGDRAPGRSSSSAGDVECQ